MAWLSGRTACVVIALFAPAAAAQAQNPPIILQPVPQVVPQFNDPGPQIRIPKPGNQLEQLAPIESVRPHLGYVAPSSGPVRIGPIHSRRRDRTHRHWYSICSDDACGEPAPRARTAKRHSRR